MTSQTDIANRALALIGTRSQIASLTEQSNEAIQTNIWIDTCRRELLRLAPWNSARNYNSLTLICAAPGTPENPTTGAPQWVKGQPPPPWIYEYAYPSDCIRPLFVVPQFTTGFSGGVPITTAVTGGAPQFWNGPPVRFQVGLDQVLNGVPAVGGPDVKVIWTNQEFAILSYLKDISNIDVMDDQLQGAWASYLASKLAIALTGDKGLANLRIKDANDMIQVARVGDGNEGLTINDVTPDFIRTRGVDFAEDFSWSPNMGIFDWGGLLATY
ncbi:MAG TPA: hypothetical protein VGA05_08290 [Candidatus Bathyarchaeia archaeon]